MQADGLHARLPLLYMLALLEGKGTAIFRAHFRRRRLQLEKDAWRKNCQREQRCGLILEDDGKIIFATFSKGTGDRRTNPLLSTQQESRNTGRMPSSTTLRTVVGSVTFLGDWTTGGCSTSRGWPFGDHEPSPSLLFISATATMKIQKVNVLGLN